MLILPWLLVKGRTFRSRNSSYRNIRFDFTAKYGEAYRAFFGLPSFVGLTLGLAYPYFAYRRSKFVVDHFVRLFGSEVGRNIRGFTSAALEKLREHSWPGNVRELSNRVKQAMVMSMGKVVDIDVLSLCSDGVSETKYPTFKEAKAEFERSYVTRCLQNVRKRSKRFLLFDEKTRNPAGRLSILIA